MQSFKKIVCSLLLACMPLAAFVLDENLTSEEVNESILLAIPQDASPLTLKGEETVDLIVGDTYIDAGVTTSDGTVLNEVIGRVNTYKAGTYILTYVGEDKSGNSVKITRKVVVNTLDNILPHDTNLFFLPKSERGYLYFADPQPSENGKNRVIRVNFKKMQFNEDNDSIELIEDAYLLEGETHSNPHSVDRAGKTNRFYVRTQNAYSFDVIAVEKGKLVYKKTIPLAVHINGKEVKYSPRAFGAYNAKYNIQLISGRNSTAKYTMVGIIDVKTDEVIKHVSRPICGDGSSATGHAKWLDPDHFAVIDRGNHSINVYKVFRNEEDALDVKCTSTVDTVAPLHALERVKEPENIQDLNTFYAMGESADINGTKVHPFAAKLLFDPLTGKLNRVNCGAIISVFDKTNYSRLKDKNVTAATHHANITPDGDYLVVPVSDGKIYKINRYTMKIKGMIDTGIEKGLGAGHIVFSKSLNIAIVTNHWSPYITIIDIEDEKFELKGYLKIYRDGENDLHHPDVKHLMQPHFAQISEDGKYFYTFASQDNGRFVKINLEELLKLDTSNTLFEYFDEDGTSFNNSDHNKILDSVDVEGAPEQAHS
jgi:6-phosphogluconolactonase (cycloisomerase 2 family)